MPRLSRVLITFLLANSLRKLVTDIRTEAGHKERPSLILPRLGRPMLGLFIEWSLEMEEQASLKMRWFWSLRYIYLSRFNDKRYNYIVLHTKIIST